MSRRWPDDRIIDETKNITISNTLNPNNLTPTIRRKDLVLSVTLFSLTVFTTLVHGAYLARNFLMEGHASANLLDIPSQLWHDPSILPLGWPFSATIMLILLAHEMGHYLACRYYRINASLPYFIPMPIISLVGTLGAFIRIRSPFAGRRALFDVGIGGPLAGFVVLLPALIYGISHSTIVPITATDNILSFENFGQPILFNWVCRLTQPAYLETTHTINLHPIGWAAWFGLLATCLNMLPIGQLDGGHVTYALFGLRWHRSISLALIGLLLFAGIPSLMKWQLPPYLVFVMVLVILGLRHPRTLDDQQAMGFGRYLTSLVALAIFLCSFMPTPITLN
ncbi:MAG: site-2 protease family protein [Acidobacteria bacterium]|nr:site-2 protease family protein [Acidobacteriota bacterium]MBI3655058.1 site-2 protease family protein [Acidobacteriota bacterium]